MRLSLERIDEARNTGRNYFLPLLKRVWVGERLNILDAVDHVIGQRLQQVGLVLQSEVLISVAAENSESIQGPVDLTGLPGLESQHESFGFSLRLRQLHLQSVIVLGFVVQAGGRRYLVDLLVHLGFVLGFHSLDLSWPLIVLKREGTLLLKSHSEIWVRVQEDVSAKSCLCSSLQSLEIKQLLLVGLEMVWLVELVVLRNAWN